MSLRHFDDGKILLLTLTYDAAPTELEPVLRALASSGQRVPGVPALIDARACGDERGARQTCERIGPILSSGVASRYAVVVGAMFGECAGCQGLLCGARTPGIDVRIFYEVGSALRWVWGLDDGASGEGRWISKAA